LLPAPIREDSNADGAAQQDDQDCCRNGDGECSPGLVRQGRMIAGFRGI
jgi:hypothetical protein